MATFAVILPAAGRSSRFHDNHYKKPFAPLENRAVWLHSAERFLNRDDVKQLIIVISPEDHESFHSKFGANVAILGIDVVHGGAERADSVVAGLALVQQDVDFVVVHDAARPCIANEWIDAVFAAAEKSDAATLATPVADTLKRVNSKNEIAETVSREGIWASQTPQVFRRQLLLDAYAALPSDSQEPPPTDEAQVVERFGRPVTVVEGSPLNRKITTKADLQLAAHLLKAMPKPKTIGGLHPFEDDDKWR